MGAPENTRGRRRPQSATTKQLLDRQADIARDLAEERWRNVAATMEGYGSAAAVRMTVLTVRPALTGFDETQPFKQRRYLAWLENWQRARHYAT
jgi:hypothetical protein